MKSFNHTNAHRPPAKIQKIIQDLIKQNQWLKTISESSENYDKWCCSLQSYFEDIHISIRDNTDKAAEWQNTGIERIFDYLRNRELTITDPIQGGAKVKNDSFRPLWRGITQGVTEAGEHYFRDMFYLFRQATGKMEVPEITGEKMKEWMDSHPSGLDEEIIEIRQRNKERIMKNIKKAIESGELAREPYVFREGADDNEKYSLLEEWWQTRRFHLRFAVRDPETLNRYLDYSLSERTMAVLRRAREEGIPFFINTYYLSLLNTSEKTQWVGSDVAIREYILYNRDIIEEYGNIEAWEKEDKVVPGKPNIAGWILPYHNNLHRRYPEVAIMIPDTLGRTCGGLCVSCQRMYEFQSGGFNFRHERTVEYEKWGKKLGVIMDYFENDKQLRDILITGGDALMSRDKAIIQMFTAVLAMAERKREANLHRPDGDKYAEIRRIRLGTRLPAYLPQRVTKELVKILSDFKSRGMKAGIRQFIIQTHFESSMEVTPDAVRAVQMLIGAGWLVTNQHVFTVASSRRGHLAKLRATLSGIGVMHYYTFSVKGFMENRHNFATHARLMQEKHEEKCFGRITGSISGEILKKASEGNLTAVEISMILKQHNIPFIASDRSMMNLPGIGKSMTFRTIGITPDGRRILEFEYDHSRKHSPVINKHKKVIIVESKPVGAYLHQVENMGEDPGQYSSIFGYSQGESEKLFPLFKYPDYRFTVTEELNNFGYLEE